MNDYFWKSAGIICVYRIRYRKLLKTVYLKQLILTSSNGMEKVMAPHSNTLAWKIQRIEKPGRLQSMGTLRVGYDWATSLSLFTFMHWRRKWQPTPVFLPRESQGWGSLVGFHLWGHTELNTTEVMQQQQQQFWWKRNWNHNSLFPLFFFFFHFLLYYCSRKNWR